MIAQRSNWKDVQRCYDHSYIKIRGFGDKLFYVTRVTADLMSGEDSEGTGFELWLDDEFPFEIDYVLPHHAVFQYGEHAVELRRVPSRQYRRGLHMDNTRIRSIISGSALDLGFPILEAFVGKQQYPTLKEAMSTTNRSTALSSRLSFHNKDGTLFMDNVVIGSVQGDVVKMTRSIFFKEVLHYINSTNQPFKVVV